ncbi:DinB family protein [Leeuwenhoekiella sp. W20_SRS_FM14]|uniref:DinB family protein n=1 Tax=Leeuwenhoekiella sp. W20_SRS_FM14 TaxID=3240270 RepID=UPI003F9C50B0
MKKLQQPEVWLRGPLKNIPPYLQPAAHALKQTEEDLDYWLTDFEDIHLWENPVGRASVGFHLQHITGVLDRMITYSKAQKLSQVQFDYLKQEGIQNYNVTISQLKAAYSNKLDEAFLYFSTLKEVDLLQKRSVGRKELPSTVLGLLFHAAEHSQRHLGQLLVTTSILKTLK